MFKKKTTTISFEGSEIRFLCLKGTQVLSWKTSQLAPEHMSQGLVHQPAIAGRILQSALNDLNAGRRNVISSVSGSRSVHRIIRVPAMPDKLLEEAIQRKARQEFAIPLEDTDLSWQIISREGDQILLYVLAVPRNQIDQQVSALREAAIKVKVLDIKPLALTRIASQGTAMIVNLEEHAMGVIVQANHIPTLIRNIPLESGDLTGEAKLDLLGQELARTVKYYNESNKQDRLPENTPIFLSGALFASDRLNTSPSLADRLQSQTPYPLRPPATNLEIPQDFPAFAYAVNLGLAAKSAK